MILICYDGSADSRAAVEHAGELFEGQPATVLTVWEPFTDVIARTTYGFATMAGMDDVEDIDRASRENAEKNAREGAQLANDAAAARHRARGPRGIDGCGA